MVADEHRVGHRSGQKPTKKIGVQVAWNLRPNSLHDGEHCLGSVEEPAAEASLHADHTAQYVASVLSQIDH